MSDRDELVELMGRYANMPDTKDWDVLPRSIFGDEFLADFSAFGGPTATITREAWCESSRQSFAAWEATHHSITSHLVTVEGDTATIRAHLRAEHWLPAGTVEGSNRWLVVGFYDNHAVRTPQGWRLSVVKLTPTYQENQQLLATARDIGEHPATA